MKRRIFAGGIVALITGIAAGCSGPERAATPEAAAGSARAGGWVTPPLIDSVERGPNALIVQGSAAPLGRVVLR